MIGLDHLQKHDFTRKTKNEMNINFQQHSTSTLKAYLLR